MTSTRRRTKSSTVTTWQRGRHTSVVKGPVRIVHPVLKRLGLPWQWDSQVGAYLVSVKRVDDLLAALELDGHHVQAELPPW